ncbi:MAG: alpha-glucosidase [Verrucomicrobia bacterium]|nr:alpha-glucosidase [Verrucomicrobiota bacterium]
MLEERAPIAKDQKVAWWRGAVIYEIYVRSFQDSNGDGIGDLPGITSRLEYIADLGVDAIWLTPFFTSPMSDFGYDVSDYRSVDPQFGTLADFEALADKAQRLGLRIVVDLVFNHTSNRHPWFQESSANQENSKKDWYVWAEPKPDGNPPNNWLSVFGGPAWQWESRRRQFYLHNFLKEQPDLNLHNPAVQDELLAVAEFWLDRGVSGLRLDAANFYFHDPELRDNPPWPTGQAYEGEGRVDNPYYWQKHVFDKSRPENIPFLRRLRGVLDRYPDAFAVAEVADDQPVVRTAEYLQSGVLHTAYNFSFLGQAITPEQIVQTLSAFSTASPEGWPSWAFSNHDSRRIISRWPKEVDQIALSKMLLTLLLTLRGTVFLYQGEELGLPEAEVPFAKLRDPYGIAFWPDFKGRDGCRTPHPWTNDPPLAGFSTVEPWLPIDHAHFQRAVAVEQKDNNSPYSYTREFLAWRKQQFALTQGELVFEPSSDHALLFFRREANTQRIGCVFNFSDRFVCLHHPNLGKLLFSERVVSTNKEAEIGPFGFALFDLLPG